MDISPEAIGKLIAGAKGAFGRTTCGLIVLLVVFVVFFGQVSGSLQAAWCYYVAFSLVVFVGLLAIAFVLLGSRAGSKG